MVSHQYSSTASNLKLDAENCELMAFFTNEDEPELRQALNTRARYLRDLGERVEKEAHNRWR